MRTICARCNSVNTRSSTPFLDQGYIYGVCSYGQFRCLKAATGERLVITSLTRPLSRQPENASALSVHPAGMAVDLRIPASKWNRAWLEQTLLSLEDKAVLDVTREHHPPHYHVAVFPVQYEQYVASR